MDIIISENSSECKTVTSGIAEFSSSPFPVSQLGTDSTTTQTWRGKKEKTSWSFSPVLHRQQTCKNVWLRTNVVCGHVTLSLPESNERGRVGKREMLKKKKQNEGLASSSLSPLLFLSIYSTMTKQTAKRSYSMLFDQLLSSLPIRSLWYCTWWWGYYWVCYWRKYLNLTD